MIRRCAVLTALLAIATIAPAFTQTLPRLTVLRFTLSADTANPQLEVPFHLIVRVNVRQRVNGLDDLNLPILAELELLGDERGVTSNASGTAYREVITVVAHHTGAIHIQPATLEAIDARDGRAKEYFSNSLTLHVSGGPLLPLREAGSAVAMVAFFALKLILALLGLGCAALIVLLLFRARRTRLPESAPPPPSVIPPVAEVPIDPWEELRDSYLVLRVEPTRSNALRARSIARRMVGASDDETLEDVMHRPSATDPRLRTVLVTLERAAFTYDSDVHAAIAEALITLERATHA